MEFSSRKPARLSGYDYSQSGAYFITVCTKDKAKILCNIVGADALIGPQIQLTEKGKIVERYIKSINDDTYVKVDKYTIMPNHVHLLISIACGPMRASAPTKSIPSIMRSFKSLVTKEAGQVIFQRSYYDHIIRDEKDYLVRWNYIDTNPAKWLEDEYYN